jgi:predicted transcriptional regulator
MPAELSVSLDEGLMEQLNSLATETHRSREEWVAVAVERLVEDEGAWVAKLRRGVREAEAGMFIPHEEVEAWAESLGTANPLPRPQARKLIR